MILKYFLIIIFFLITNCLVAQVNNNLPPNPESSLNKADVLPQYPGGDSLMYVFIQENSPYKVYPKPEKGLVNGLIFCSLSINEDGSILNVQILKGSNEEHNNLLKQIAKKMPKWNPAKKDEKAIASQIGIVVGFGEKLKK